MIVEAVGDVVKTFLLYLINNVMPDMAPGAMTSIINGLGSFSALMEGVKYFIPFGALTICFGVVMGIYATMFVLSVLNWLVKKVPGVS